MYSIDLKCEVAGLDPTYGFPRICDSTALHRIFKEEVFFKNILLIFSVSDYNEYYC